MIQSGLPAAAIAERLNESLKTNGCVVVTAPPGAGKSTLLPLTILEGVGGRILMLEPRRVAARQIAARMASMLGENVGETVGYRVRFESRVSARTRIEVLTEGILARMLTDDPTLEGVDVIIFDEFHERSLHSDLALALARQSQGLIRDDLRIVIMSATIDAQSICEHFGAPLIESEGRMFPVDIRYQGEVGDLRDLAFEVARTVKLAHKEHEGDILAFLPGEADIRRCAEILGESLEPTKVYPLYGNLDFKLQADAIAPSAPGTRKIVLATPIAETSLTIEGVRVVVDSGYCRKQVFDQQTGLSRLETVRISLDMAGQRAGRAGRVAPGVCYRLWNKGAETLMAPNRTPEMLEADLAPMVLQIAAWGEADASRLDWLTPPPAYNLNKAYSLLEMLGAVSPDGRVTKRGLTLSAIPCHPRIANMLCGRGQGSTASSLAADLAAMLDERDPLRSDEADITLRVNELRRSRSRGSAGAWDRIARASLQYCRLAGVRPDNSPADPFEAGALLALAYPERIARQSGLKYHLSGGGSVILSQNDPLSAYEWIAVASLNAAQGADGRVFLAAPLDPSDVLGIARERRVLAWESRAGTVAARIERGVGSLVIESKPLSDVSRDDVVAAICAAAPKDGLSMFDFSDEVSNLQRRIAAVAQWHPELGLPGVSTPEVLARASEWLPLYIGKANSAAQLRKIDMCAVIWGLLSYDQQQAVDRIAPTHIQVPTGSRIRVEYRQGADAPVLRVRLQECFGLEDTPCVDGGSRKLLMELLSPGFKPVQLTSDLRSFWSGTYFEVRKELARRYPRHSWPDNPLDSAPVRGVKKSGS